ncbi:MAG: helix-turn-helix transcriptional regulator [Micrococcales bacterium]|nr:helix-turn-helix transcriptional regulator [Micrococcales bacterium]
MKNRTPAAARRALADLGEHLRTWRRLNGVTQQLLAERAGVSVPTLRALESGASVSTDTLVRVLRALGVLDTVVDAADPMNSDVGRLRAGQHLPERVRLARPR